MSSRGFLRPCAATLILFSSLVGAAHADATFTSPGSFLANVLPGYYLETFDGLNAAPDGTFLGVDTLSYSQGGFAFDVSSDGGLYGVVPDLSQPADSAISTINSIAPLTFSFNGKGVTAVGGNFFQTDLAGQAQSGDVRITLSDGSSVTLTGSSSDPQPFVGFTTTGAYITSLTVESPSFSTANNLIVGAATPEPGAVAFGLLAGGGIVGLIARKRRG